MSLANPREQILRLSEERLLRHGRERRPLLSALAAACLLHAALLAARLPQSREALPPHEPDRTPPMKLRWLAPPPPPLPEPPPSTPPPAAKKVPRPDPTPDQPEPVAPPSAPPPPTPSLQPAALSPTPVPAMFEEAQPVAPPPPPEPPPVPEETGPIRVAPGKGPGIIRRVEPLYPALARTLRQQGTVVLDVVIRRDGTVAGVTVVRSAKPILDQAAIDALRQWRFSSGDHDVVMILTIHFSLR